MPNGYRELHRSFNTNLFTVARTPLQLTDQEKLLYYGDDVEFFIKVGEGGLSDTFRHHSKYGTIFVTSHRVIYIPSVYTLSFCSFSIIATSIVDIVESSRKNLELYVMLNGGVLGKMYLNMRNNLPQALIRAIHKAQEELHRLV
ncbi:hypothetical protein NEOKW01_2040 [Nematocida sp. AWRm80]|nr:hypothetical protein NEOKW01_2040 [Nematocida sp. AWRm80]